MLLLLEGEELIYNFYYLFYYLNWLKLLICLSYYLYSQKVCLRHPYVRPRLTDERMDGWTSAQTHRQTDRLTQRNNWADIYTDRQTHSHYNIDDCLFFSICLHIFIFQCVYMPHRLFICLSVLLSLHLFKCFQINLPKTAPFWSCYLIKI